ncbi:EAL domain-containing protein [Bowmanella sp. JS7-9]|uniref:EAL domain-containing protein n=1 Tax=Pseudobowmanella zhangzhouensis TaxID=1537679 RepID=A0ABW1XN81_9ALTE|nr:EAL domain-containing protein [Bowmanella sp. JS7-9]
MKPADTLLFEIYLVFGSHMHVKLIDGKVDLDHIVPYFQPVIDLHTHSVVSYECLARLVTASAQLFLPSEFLSLVEQDACSGQLAQRIFSLSAHYFRDTSTAWSINLCASDVCDKQFLVFIREQLGDYPDPHRVTLEVKGESALACAERFAEFLGWCRETGINVVIDRFDPAISPAAHILSLPIQGIKLDGQLSRHFASDVQVQQQIRELAQQSAAKNIVLIAEHIEDEATLEAARELGIRYAQGFYFSQPQARV